MHLRYLVVLIAFVAINASKKRFDGNLLVSVVPFAEEQMKLLSDLEDQNEINIWNEIRRNGSVHVMIDKVKQSWLLPLFESVNLEPSIIYNDVQKLLDEEEQTIRARAGYPRSIIDEFYDYDQYSEWLQQISSAYPQLAQLSSIGKTYNGRDIWLIKLTANSGNPKKTALIDFGIHAREWISPATGAFIINELLTTYGRSNDAKEILDNWELHIVPILNPDGYAYTFSNDRMWRKNRRPAGSCIGVDLNRNFGYEWNTGGSSSNPCSDTYHGGSPMSENEAKALESYASAKPWSTYLTFHSYGQWWFTNWGYTTRDPPSYGILLEKAQIGADAIQSVHGRRYTIGSSAQLLYIASGGSEDWTRGTLGVLYSYCLELPPTGSPGFIVPPSEIAKTGIETYVGIVAYLNSF